MNRRRDGAYFAFRRIDILGENAYIRRLAYLSKCNHRYAKRNRESPAKVVRKSIFLTQSTFAGMGSMACESPANVYNPL